MSQFKIVIKDSKSTEKIQTSPCVTYDFTAHENAEDLKFRFKMIESLNRLCKKWAFQREKGEEKGQLHWQGRISLKDKVRIHQVKDLFGWGWWTLTSNECRSDQFYVMKEKTRIDGPWTDQDAFTELPRDVTFDKLRPWQEEMMYRLSQYDERTIDVVIDLRGNLGKSKLIKWAECHGKATEIPLLKSASEIMQAVYGSKTSKIYFIDVPRSFDQKKKMGELFTAVEMIKDGKAYDPRYLMKKKWFDPPRICVFMNICPDLKALSLDRWRLHSIDESDRLIPYKK